MTDSIIPSPDELTALRAELELASRDPVMNLASRFGWERKYGRGQTYVGDIIFMDVDFMKAINAAKGYAGTNNLLQCAFDLTPAGFKLRATDFTSRWLNGDEFVLMVGTNDAPGLVTRLQESFALLGVAFTACYVSCNGQARPLVETLAQTVVTGKENGRRGETWRL